MSDLCATCYELPDECICWHCEKCYDEELDLNVGTYMYDENHGKICELCCAHDIGWWRLDTEVYGEDMYACRAGCGELRTHEALEGERVFTTSSKGKKEQILRAVALAQGTTPEISEFALESWKAASDKDWYEISYKQIEAAIIDAKERAKKRSAEQEEEGAS